MDEGAEVDVRSETDGRGLLPLNYSPLPLILLVLQRLMVLAEVGERFSLKSKYFWKMWG
jgi:hypothetical protein